jgi:hypothetical protein
LVEIALGLSRQFEGFSRRFTPTNWHTIGFSILILPLMQGY